MCSMRAVSSVLALALLLLGGCLRLMEPDSDSGSVHHESGCIGACDDDDDTFLECDPAQCAPYGCDYDDRCRTSCEADHECTDDAHCEDGECIGPVCSEETAAETCRGYACHRGRCETSCDFSSDCAEGYVCPLLGGECTPKCQSHWDAGCLGFSCDIESGRCEDFCLDDDECAPGHRCEHGTCARDPSVSACSKDSDASVCFPYGCDVELGLCRTQCSASEDCAADSSCDHGVCRMPCQTQSDPACKGFLCDAEADFCELECDQERGCAAGYACSLDFELESNGCFQVHSAQSCGSDADCFPFRCGENGLCWESCEQSGCAEGAACSYDTCEVACSSENDPACGGFACLRDSSPATCLNTCLENTDCAVGYRCENEVCVAAARCDENSAPGVCGNYACDLTFGQCFTQCKTDAQCTTAEVSFCSRGNCI